VSALRGQELSAHAHIVASCGDRINALMYR